MMTETASNTIDCYASCTHTHTRASVLKGVRQKKRKKPATIKSRAITVSCTNAAILLDP